MTLAGLPNKAIGERTSAELDYLSDAGVRSLEGLLVHAQAAGDFGDWWGRTGAPFVNSLIQRQQTAAVSATATQLAQSMRDLTGFQPPVNHVLPSAANSLIGTTSWTPTVRTALLDSPRVRGGYLADGLEAKEATAKVLRFWQGVSGAEPHRINRDVLHDISDHPAWKGWARVAERNACAFCRMLATRGAVYTKQTVTHGRNGLRYHSHCRCHGVPVIDPEARAALKEDGAHAWSQMRATDRPQDDGSLLASAPDRADSRTPKNKTGPGPRTSGEVRAIVNAAIERAQMKHPSLKVMATISNRVKGSASGQYTPSSSGGPRIAIARRSRGPQLTALHEIGHYVDEQVLGKPGSWASQVQDPALREWKRAVAKSRHLADIEDDANRAGTKKALEDADYLARPQELFARSYAQWIASSSGPESALRAELNEQIGFGRHWDEDDFRPIAAALDKLFGGVS